MRTKEQIDNVNIARKDLGLEPVPYEHEQTSSGDQNPPAGDPPANDKDKTKVAPLTNDATPAKPSATTEPEEETDEQLVEKLKKRGFNINSIADIKPQVTPEDIEKQKRDRASKKLSYGLEKGLFNSDEYNSFRKDYDDPLAVVKDDFRQDLLKDEPTLTDEDINERFEEIYHQNEDQSTYRFKRGKKAIETQAEQIVRQKHAKILSLDSAFDAHEAEIQETTATQEKVNKAVPAYKAAVEAAIVANKKLVLQAADGESFETEALEDQLADIKKNFLSEKVMRKSIIDGTTPENLNRAVRLSLLEKGFNDYTLAFAEQYHIARAKGTKGIPQANRQAPADKQNRRVFTDDQKLALDDAGLSRVYTEQGTN